MDSVAQLVASIQQALRASDIGLTELLARVDETAEFAEIVLARDLTSGEIHRRARIAGRPGLQSYEQCNLDAAGGYEVLKDLSGIKSTDELCGVCYSIGELEVD